MKWCKIGRDIGRMPTYYGNNTDVLRSKTTTFFQDQVYELKVDEIVFTSTLSLTVGQQHFLQTCRSTKDQSIQCDQFCPSCVPAKLTSSIKKGVDTFHEVHGASKFTQKVTTSCFSILPIWMTSRAYIKIGLFIANNLFL